MLQLQFYLFFAVYFTALKNQHFPFRHVLTTAMSTASPTCLGDSNAATQTCLYPTFFDLLSCGISRGCCTRERARNRVQFQVALSAHQAIFLCQLCRFASACRSAFFLQTSLCCWFRFTFSTALAVEEFIRSRLNGDVINIYSSFSRLAFVKNTPTVGFSDSSSSERHDIHHGGIRRL